MHPGKASLTSPGEKRGTLLSASLGKGFFAGTPEDKYDRGNGDEEFREMGSRRRRRVGPAYRLIVAGRREARLRDGRSGTRRGCGNERGTGVDGDGGQGVSLPVRLPSLPGGLPERLPASARKGRDAPDEGEDDGAS